MKKLFSHVEYCKTFAMLRRVIQINVIFCRYATACSILVLKDKSLPFGSLKIITDLIIHEHKEKVYMDLLQSQRLAIYVTPISVLLQCSCLYSNNLS